jgi:hypothetical protein
MLLRLQDADKADGCQPASVQRLPLASMQQNSLQLTDWTKGLTMPGKKRAVERQKLQERLVSVAVVPAGLPAGGALPWVSLLSMPALRHPCTCLFMQTPLFMQTMPYHRQLLHAHAPLWLSSARVAI